MTCELDPYTLGATPSGYGDTVTYGQRDEYVPRAKDRLLTAALHPNRLVVLAGPSKAGKTRSAFELIRAHDEWSTARLAAPEPQSLGQLVGHSVLRSSESLVIWLDELHRFLPPTGGLSPTIVSALLDRPGPTVLVATMRAGLRDRLRDDDSELTRAAREVLGRATWVELASTRQDPAEQARAAAVYPELASLPDGLAETLAGAPAGLRAYRRAATANPLLHMLVQTCVDWVRCGITRPIPEADLLVLTRAALKDARPDLSAPDHEIRQVLRQAHEWPAAGNHVALLHSYRSAGPSYAYEAPDYLVATDDGQDGGQPRPVPESAWSHVLELATDQEAASIAICAYLRENIPVAVTASRRAAEAGDADSQYNLGTLLATKVNPPDLPGARTWWAEAARAGHTDAQYNLGTLLATRLNPPDLPGARTWWAEAARAGHTNAQYNLGIMLAYELDPPELAEARTWWTQAAEAGDVAAQYDLGRLLADRLDPPDPGAARAWWTKAAHAGHSGAQYGLGVLLACEHDPPDLAAARAWWTKAAHAGHSGAQYHLGRLLALGLSPVTAAAAASRRTKAAPARPADGPKHIESGTALVQVPSLTDPGP